MSYFKKCAYLRFNSENGHNNIVCAVAPFHVLFVPHVPCHMSQALEPETLIPLALAGERTKVVLAGDHMQMDPPCATPPLHAGTTPSVHTLMHSVPHLQV